MRFGLLILTASLLVGCGSKTTQLNVLDQCRDALDISSALTPETPSLDRTTLVALAKVKCGDVLADDKSFEILALEKREKIFKGIKGIKFEEYEIRPAEEDIPKSLLGKVTKKQPSGDYEPFTIYSIYVADVGLDYDVFEWQLYPDAESLKESIEYFSK